MSSAPNIPGVEAGAPPWLGGCERVLTAGALEMLAALDGTFGPRRAELPDSRGPRRRAGRGVLPEFLAGPQDARQGRWRLAPGLADHRVEITGRTDRKMVINALNCGAMLFMADQGVPVGRHLADALDGPRHAGLAQYPDGRFGPLAPFTKE
jgi:malate synthase